MDLSQLLQVTVTESGELTMDDMGKPSQFLSFNSGGKFTFGYQYRHVLSEGYYQGSNEISDLETLALFPVVPTEITQQAHLFSIGYIANPKWAFQVTIPRLYQSTFHIRRGGEPFTLESKGIGDITTQILRSFHLESGVYVYAGLGIGLPSGTITATGDTPRGPDSQLPYAMQLGSGTVDLKPTVGMSTDLGSRADAGADIHGVIRLGENDREYTLGNLLELDAWYSYDLTTWLRLRPELGFRVWGDIDGMDPEVALGIAPVAEPDNYGGTRLDASLAAQILLTDQRFVEIAAKTPLAQDLNGTQIGNDWIYSVGLKWAF
tara:strand:- start:4129 stop:5088 length:960 start_codon:yes stop_codon:yes gene_type:complete